MEMIRQGRQTRTKQPRNPRRSHEHQLTRTPALEQRRWEFVAENNDPNFWTWRSILADGTTEREAKRHGMTFGGALVDAVTYGFNPKIDHWEVR